MRTFLGLLFLCGCSDSAIDKPPGNDLAAGPDLARSSPPDLSSQLDLSSQPGDLSSPPDLGTLPTAQVQCGTMTCASPKAVCCRSEPFGAGTCIGPNDPCSAQRYACDNDSDCGAGLICCIETMAGGSWSGSSCVTAAACTAMMGSEGCLVGQDCSNGQMCCGVGPTPNYHCTSGACPISRRSFKKDIRYLEVGDIDELRRELLGYRLATYHYRTQKDDEAKHLGFIIDDVEPSASIDASGQRVDLYGYMSMAVATLQAQARQIAALEKQVKRLEQRLERKR